MHPFEPSINDFKPIINKIKVQDKPEIIVMICFENDYVPGVARGSGGPAGPPGRRRGGSDR